MNGVSYIDQKITGRHTHKHMNEQTKEQICHDLSIQGHKNVQKSFHISVLVKSNINHESIPVGFPSFALK